MKAVIILAIFATLGIIFFLYNRNKDIKKLLISLITFAAIIALAVLGNVTRPVMPIFMAHSMFILVAWGGLIYYLIKERYYYWIIFSPVVTLVLFLVLELLVGSSSEIS